VRENGYLLAVYGGGAGCEAFLVSNTCVIISKNLIRGVKENAFRLGRQLIFDIDPSHFLSLSLLQHLSVIPEQLHVFFK